MGTRRDLDGKMMVCLFPRYRAVKDDIFFLAQCLGQNPELEAPNKSPMVLMSLLVVGRGGVERGLHVNKLG